MAQFKECTNLLKFSRLLTLVLLAFVILYSFLGIFKPSTKQMLFAGINQIIFVSGLFVLALYFIRQYFKCISNRQRILEKRIDYLQKLKLQKESQTEAIERIKFEKQRVEANDYFELAKLAIEKTITTPSPDSEEKREEYTMNEKILTQLFELYQTLRK